MTERIAIYPGTFDPPTNGHLDIVERAAKMFDRIVVGVGMNRAKKTFFADDERISLMREACARLVNVEVKGFDTLTVDFARAVGAKFVIRGIRALSDFEFEFEMANMNRQLAPEVEMVFLMTSPEYLFLSASRVKELAAFGAPVDRYVPPNVAKRLAAQAKKGGLRTGATEPSDCDDCERDSGSAGSSAPRKSGATPPAKPSGSNGVSVLLAVDVGNTNVVIGAYRGTTLLRTWRAATDVDRTEDELAVMLDALLAQEELRIADVASLVVGSVVPPLTLAFTRLAERHLEGRVLVIGPGVKTGVRLRVDNPSEVGADRIANTLAAHRRYGGPAIVVDFGTSTSFDVVSAEGDFLGGAFAPGLEISSESLFGRASRLFRVPLTPPREAIGKNTSDCLRSGIVYGYVGLVEGLLERLCAELDGTPRIVATGGLATTIAPLTTRIERVDEDLTLEGLRLLWELNA